MIRCFLMLWLTTVAVACPASADIYDEVEAPAAEVIPRYDPAGEGLRSVLLPGWSQYRQGHDNAGFAYAAIAAVTLVFATGVIEVPFLNNEKDNFGQVLAGVIYGLNAAASGFDAHNRARESNRENGWDLEQSALRRPTGVWLPLVRVQF